jgi:menaquinone-specific isochorismate synthase
VSPAPDPGELRAVTVPLDGPGPDPLDLAGAEGSLFAGPALALAGRGQAAVLELPRGLEDPGALDRAVAWLAAVPHRDGVARPGSRLGAQGALPFDRGRPGRLVVPELTMGRDAEGSWATWVGRSGASVPDHDELTARLGALAARAPRRRSDGGPGGPPRLRARPDPAGYARSVASAVAAMATGPMAKVVLARCVDATFARALSDATVLRRLHLQEPACTAFAHDVAGGRFLGVTPELMVARHGPEVACHPLAGTVGLGGPDDEAAVAGLLESTKDRTEHRLVVEAIERVLGPRCSALSVPTHPSLVRLHSVAHLGTLIHGKLAAPDQPAEHVLALVAALHPTPAVGGVPRREALAFIRANEAVERDHWAGPVGWVDAAGDGEWMIGIRSTTVSVDGTSARLYAGAGIVAGSDPAAELAETTVKLTPVLEALAPGSGPLLGG